MKCFFLLLLVSMNAFASKAMDHKKGFVLGVGMNAGIYKFPIQFEGVTKGKIDDSATIVGPNLQLGYDVVLFNRLSIGLRAEGMLADTSGMNKEKTTKLYDHTKGKNRQVLGTLRLGYVKEFIAGSPVGDSYPMVYELFVEGGAGTGRNDFILNFEYNDGSTIESYKETLEETFNSQVLAAGFNFTSESGAYFELKVMRTNFTSNRAKREGTFLINGGTLQSFSETVKNTDPDALTSFVLTVGHHY